MAEIDPIAFRNALGTFVTGVTVITTMGPDGRRVGMTANSFNSVSLDPPLVLWSLALNSGSLEVFRTAEYWAVHVLTSGQEALSAQFARRNTDKFQDVEIEDGPGGIPLLKAFSSRFVCKTLFEHEGGDHAIFVGEVTQFERQAHLPLAFYQGGYAQVFATPRAEAAHSLAEDLALADAGKCNTHLAAGERATLSYLLKKLQ